MEIIKGILLQFTSAQLTEFCKKREETHLERHNKAIKRAEEELARHQQALADLKVSLDSDEDESDDVEYAHFSKLSMNNSRSKHVSNAKDEWDKVLFFRVYAEHIIPDKIYHLTQRDLQELRML